MAGDEPRRSGRATKGQHKTHEDTPEPTPKAKKAIKAKGSKKAAKAVEEENEEEAEEVIRCVCGDNTDDEAGRKFIACDACEVWQHNVCMGVPLEEDEQPEHYFCEQCRPEEHKELLDAMKRGEKPWEERQRLAKLKKKAPKRGRKSNAKIEKEDQPESVEPVTEEIPPPAEVSTKRKHEDDTEEKNDAANGHTQDVKETPAPPPRAEKKRKSVAKEPASQDPSSALVDISYLPKERQNVAVALAKLVSDGTRDRVKAETFRVPDGETIEGLGKRFAQLIEYELFMNHGIGGKGLQNYGAQFRAINANFKKNPALLDRLLRKSLLPADLATMSSQDMASEELQREREKMKEEADKQAVMIREDDKPRVRRTHKGDEYVDESATANAESVFTSQPVRRRESEMDIDGAGSPTAAGTAASPTATASNRPTNGATRRQSSQNFDINTVWAKTTASPDTERPPAQLPVPKAEVQHQDKPTGDADIDRLLADDDADDAYSPQDVKPSPGIIWQGKLLQPGVTSLAVSARFAAGNDFSRYVSWESLLPDMLEIEGRLERSKADDYMCGLQWSRKSDVSVLQLSPFDDRAAFDTIFDYFHSRKRYAVGKKGHGCSELIKDLYISPVDKGEQPPPHIDLLDHSNISFPNQEKILLLTIVVNKPASWDQADAAMSAPSAESAHNGPRMSLPGPAASPINTSGPQFSPAVRQGSTPDAANQSAFPPNPYAAKASPVPAAQQQYPPHYPGNGAPSQPPGQFQFSHSAAVILWPYAGCPVAQQILSATSGMVQDMEARNMKDIFDKEPRAREDMQVFSAILQGA